MNVLRKLIELQSRLDTAMLRITNLHDAKYVSLDTANDLYDDVTQLQRRLFCIVDALLEI